MSSVVERLRKRRCKTVTVAGEQVKLRALTLAEIQNAERMERAGGSLFAPLGYAIGCALLNDDESQAFTRKDGETLEDFGVRVIDESDISQDTMAEFQAELEKLGRVPSQETLQKN